MSRGTKNIVNERKTNKQINKKLSKMSLFENQMSNDKA